MLHEMHASGNYLDVLLAFERVYGHLVRFFSTPCSDFSILRANSTGETWRVRSPS